MTDSSDGSDCSDGSDVIWIPREEICDSLRENENSSRSRDMKVRKNEMKVRKNFSFPRWIFRNPSEEIFDFLRGVD